MMRHEANGVCHHAMARQGRCGFMKRWSVARRAARKICDPPPEGIRKQAGPPRRRSFARRGNDIAFDLYRTGEHTL